MTRSPLVVAIVALLVAPASAAPTLPTKPAPTAAAVSNDDTMRLARQFVALYYPTPEQDAINALKGVNDAQLAMIEPVSLRPKIEPEVKKAMAAALPILKRHIPAMMEAYAKAFAKEYTADELRQLIAFAGTPVGHHFLDNTNFADTDDYVVDVQLVMRAEIAPLFDQVVRAVCRETTQLRVASGQKDAKCPLA